MKFILKLLLRRLKSALLRLWFWRKHRKYNKINKKLKGAVGKVTKERDVLKYEIVKYIRKFLKMDTDQHSKYIPPDYKTRCEVMYNVDLFFGEEMKRLNVKLNNQLQVK